MTRKMQQIREQTRRRAEAWLLRTGSPRFQMFLIVAMTGMAGFVFSVLLLKLGLGSMALRYPIAVVLAYGVFLLLVRLWLAYQSLRGIDEERPDASDHLDSALHMVDGIDDLFTARGRGSDSGSAGAVGGAVDAEGLVYLVIALAALFAAVLVCCYIIWTGPALFAEVLVDALIMSRVYKNMKANEQPYWVKGVLRRTWVPALLVVFFFSLAGFAMHKVAKDAESIGGFIEYVAQDRE